jgi:hypothetical protein
MIVGMMTGMARAHPIAGRLASALTVLFLAVVLAACGGGGKTLDSGGGGVPGPKGKSVPPISLMALNGVPNTKAQVLKDALAEAGGNRDMAIVDGANFDQGSLGLTGNFTVLPAGEGTTISHSWSLVDKAGTTLASYSGQEQAPAATGGDPWSGVTPAVLQRIAQEVTRNLAQRLSELGYATQVGITLPPVDGWRFASAEDGKKLDEETLYGPNFAARAKLEHPSPTPVTTASIAKLDPTPKVAAEVARPAEPESVEPQKVAKKPAGKAQAIRAVAVLPVSGAPGSGNGELTGALRKVLMGAGWPVVHKAQADALTIAGAVKVMPAEGETQKVALAWTVKAPDGRVLGTIKQANDVPKGSLDKGWGEGADQAAQAAAIGIFNLVKKLR